MKTKKLNLEAQNENRKSQKYNLRYKNQNMKNSRI